jgi:hypothetical protein
VELRHLLDELLGGGASTAAGDPFTGQRAFVLSYAQAAMRRLPDLLPAGSTRYDADQQWMRALASATPFTAARPHQLEAPEETLRLSSDWSAMVLRDGASFLTHDPSSMFHPHAAAYARTLYLDALLLSRYQTASLRLLADQAADLGDPVAHPQELRALQRRLTAFRNRCWWEHLTARSGANVVVSAAHRQQGTDTLANQVFDEVSAYAGEVATVAAERTQAIAGLIGIFGVVLATSFGLVQTFDETWGDRTEAILLVAGLAAALLVTVLLHRFVIDPLFDVRALVKGLGSRPALSGLRETPVRQRDQPPRIEAVASAQFDSVTDSARDNWLGTGGRAVALTFSPSFELSRTYVVNRNADLRRIQHQFLEDLSKAGALKSRDLRVCLRLGDC